MRLSKAVFAAGLLAVLAAPSIGAVAPIGVIKTYDASKRIGTMIWEAGAADQVPVYFTADPGVPVLKAGDRVLTDMRPVNPGLPNGTYQPMTAWVTGLAAPGDTSPPLNPYASLAASLNKKSPPPAPPAAPAPAPAPMGTVKTFDAGRGQGTILLDGQTAPAAFRPWPAFAFKPKAGDRLRYAFVEQWGTTVLWAAPLEGADSKP